MYSTRIDFTFTVQGTVWDAGVKIEIGIHGAYLHGSCSLLQNTVTIRITVIVIMISTMTSLGAYCEEEAGPGSSIHCLHGSIGSHV